MHQGPIRKMRASLAETVHYELPMGEEHVALNPLLGARIALRWTGAITCIHCARAIKKSFGQGYCYPCFTRLARCDSCVVKPELCHYDQGTCREPEWGEAHCLISHTVYLANSSGLKVGITRGTNPLTRWIDQGASEALAIRTVPSRLDAGRVEVAFKDLVADRTNWRRMLKGDPEPLDLEGERDRLLAELAARSPGLQLPGAAPGHPDVMRISYPVLAYPQKISSHNLDKSPSCEGVLQGIKGQYLILDTGVINMRKYGGYELALETG